MARAWYSFSRHPHCDTLLYLLETSNLSVIDLVSNRPVTPHSGNSCEVLWTLVSPHPALRKSGYRVHESVFTRWNSPIYSSNFLQYNRDRHWPWFPAFYQYHLAMDSSSFLKIPPTFSRHSLSKKFAMAKKKAAQVPMPKIIEYLSIILRTEWWNDPTNWTLNIGKWDTQEAPRHLQLQHTFFCLD